MYSYNISKYIWKIIQTWNYLFRGLVLSTVSIEATQLCSSWSELILGFINASYFQYHSTLVSSQLYFFIWRSLNPLHTVDSVIFIFISQCLDQVSYEKVLSKDLQSKWQIGCFKFLPFFFFFSLLWKFWKTTMITDDLKVKMMILRWRWSSV